MQISQADDLKLLNLASLLEISPSPSTPRIPTMDQTQQPPAKQPPGPIITLSPNITIRPYTPTDAPSLAHHANNAAIWNNLRNRMPFPYTEAHSKTWIAHANTATIATGPFDPSTARATGPKIPAHYAIVLDGAAVGSIGLEFGDPDEVYARTAELGYWLGEAYWGRGVMGMVVPAFVRWAWETFGVLARLNAEVDEENAGSRRCLERAGFAVEGRRRKALVKNGELRDAVFMGMLRPGTEEA